MEVVGGEVKRAGAVRVGNRWAILREERGFTIHGSAQCIQNAQATEDHAMQSSLVLPTHGQPHVEGGGRDGCQVNGFGP